MARLKKQNLKKQAEGVWVNWEDGIAFKIARIGNPLSVKLSEEYAARNRALKEEGKPEVPFSVLELKLISEATVLDWRNLDDDDGSPLAYSVESCVKIFSDPLYVDLKEFVQQQSLKRANFIEGGDAATEKNLQPLSSQTSASAATSGEPLKLGLPQTTQADESEPHAN